MKNFCRISFVFIAVFAISLSSCKKPKELKNPLVGTWLISDTKIELTSSNPMYQTVLNTAFGNANDYIELPEQLVFNEDGTGTYAYSSGNEPFTYTKTDSKLTMNGKFNFGFGLGADIIAFDYQLLDDDKTLKCRWDVTELALPLVRWFIEDYIDNLPISIDIDDVMSSISKIEIAATYKK